MQATQFKEFQQNPKRTKIRINSLRKLERFDLKITPKKSISLQKLSNKYQTDQTKQQPINHSISSDQITKIMKGKLLNPAKKLQNKSLERLTKFQNIRKSTLISWSPSSNKQCQAKQYQTFLKVSASSWLLYDYRKDTYNRGWKVADKGDFSGFIRLVLLKALLNLLSSNPNLLQFQARMNVAFLKEQIEMKKQLKRSPEKKRGLILREVKDQCFCDNTVAKILDIFYGLFMTKYDDIVEYSVIILGYLANCQLLKIDPVNDQPCFYVEKVNEAFTYKKYFAEYAEKYIFPKLQMQDSKVTEHYLQSTPNDICRLYLSIEESQLFRQLTSCKQITCFRYWENRIKTFRNLRLDLGQNYLLTLVWQSKRDYSVICYNKQLKILIILGDCRYGMAQPDIRIIQQWVKSTRNPIVDFRKTHLRLLPLMRISEPKEETLNSKSSTIQKEPYKKIKQNYIKNF